MEPTKTPERKMPADIAKRLRSLLKELESKDGKDVPTGGKMELHVDEKGDVPLWYVAYSTTT